MSGLEFRDDEIHEILRRASAIQSAHGTSRELLERSAAELGISPEALAEAEAAYIRERGLREERAAYDRDRRAEFFSHFGSYLAVNAFLFGINYLTGPGHWWAFYPLLGWGIGIVGHAINAFSRGGADVDRDFERWRKRRRRRQERASLHEDEA